MEPGREMDALVAKKVMGLDRPGLTDDGCPTCGYFWLAEGSYRGYSTDIASAWQVVEKLYENYIVNIKGTNTGNKGSTWKGIFYVSVTGKGVSVTAQSDTAPHAICLAALEAVGALPQ